MTTAAPQEVTQIQQKNGTALAADVLDVGGRRAARHQPVRAVRGRTWSRYPGEPEGGDRALGRGLRRLHVGRLQLGEVRHDHLAEPAARAASSRTPWRSTATRPQANAALNGVMMASLALGGSAGSIANGVNFFHKLKKAGNFNTTQATAGDDQGRHHASGVQLGLPQHRGRRRASRPPPGRSSSRRTPRWAASTTRPSTRTRRTRRRRSLWEEYLFSQASVGGQNLWLEGGARPV